MIGYCQEMACLQYRHLPRKKIKLKIGIKSQTPNSCPHLGQIDRRNQIPAFLRDGAKGAINPRLSAFITQLKKLPKIKPAIPLRIKNIIFAIDFSLIQFYHFYQKQTKLSKF